MQEAVAKPFRLGARELVLEAQEPCPSKEVLGDEAHDEPARVDGEGLRGELAHAGVLPVADAALGSTATAMERLAIEDVGVFEIGQADLETVAVASVELSWTPACGSSRRAIALVPSGQLERSIRSHLGNFYPLALFGPVG